MIARRIGNDFIIEWRVFVNGKPHILDGRNLELHISKGRQFDKVMPFTVSGNCITTVFFGKDQRVLGEYCLTLYENRGEEGMHTLDACEAFELVSCDADVAPVCCMSSIKAESVDVRTYSIGEKGEPGKDGNPGKDGKDGKSAYAIAVEGGYEGSEKEFNKLLNDIAGFDREIAENTKQIATRPIVVYLRGDETQADLASLYSTLDKYLNDGTPFVVQMAMNEGIVEMTTICRSEADIFLGATLSQTDFDELTEDGGEIESANIQFYALLSSDGIMKSGQSLDTHNRMRLEEALNKKANTEGDYPDMSVGVAENLVGRGEAVDTMFSYRSAGGVKPSGIKRSIETGDARITSIKGNSVVVNQYFKALNSTISNGITLTPNSDMSFTLTGTMTEEKNTIFGLGGFKVKEGDKIFIKGTPYGGSATTFAITDQGRQSEFGQGAIWETQSYFNLNNFVPVVRIYPDMFGQEINLTFKPRYCNLTQMFGAGNEPTTVEEFYARVGELPDEYDAGTLRDTQVSAIETTGFNQWDEEWEVGSLNSLGGNASATNTIRSTNFIKVLPNTKYYLKSNATDNILVYAYDAKKQFVERIAVAKNTIITTNDNNFYIRFRMGDAYGSTYNHDICINLSHSGYKDGTYKPYEVFRRAMPDLSKYFEGGVMRRAGNVCDEFRYNPTTQQWEAIQRVGVVDLGSLDWTYNTENSVWVARYNIMSGDNSLMSIYPQVSRYTSLATMPNKTIKTNSNLDGYLYLKDESITETTSINEILSRVMLNYELAEPDEKPVTENLNLVYDVNDFGTERAIQPEDSAPFRADVVYGFNAIDTIRTNAEAIEQLFARVTALESKTTSE